jgi:hypothetical protein
MGEKNLEYHVYDTREQWLEARKTTVGASSLAHFIATGQLPSPPPDVPAVQSAIQFGSIWEPMVVKLYAEHLHLDLASKNTPLANLAAGQLAWYDNSFYTDGRMHVSLDAAYRDRDGLLHTVEVKTGSKPSYAFLSAMQHRQYSAQAQLEARMVGAKFAEIIYAQRPTDWERLSSDAITEHIGKTLDIVFVSDIMEQDAVDGWYDAYKKDDGSEDGLPLMSEMLEAKERYENAKERLTMWLAEHPGERVHCDGHVARLVETSRTTTDYATLFGQHPEIDLKPFQKTSKAIRLSIVKEKKNA